MTRQPQGSARVLLRCFLLASCAAVAVGAAATQARAARPSSCSLSSAPAYSLSLTALTGPAGADLTLSVDAADGCATAETLKLVQLKIYGRRGRPTSVRVRSNVAAPGGTASIELGRVPRDRRVEALVLVEGSSPRRTYVVREATVTRLRPDLTVASMDAPAQTLTTRPVRVAVDVAELNGDTGSTATVSVSWGPSLLGSQEVTVAPKGHASVAFDDLALSSPQSVPLTVRVTGADPAETSAENNDATATVEVTKLELAPLRVLLDGLGGHGAQFNQHVFAPITPAPPDSLGDLEAKAAGLAPQLVRVWFNEAQEADPAKLASFVRTVELADEADADVIVSYQSTANAKKNPPVYMERFADVLEELAKTRGLDVRWVTIQNEINTTQVTPEQFEALYRALDAELVARGLRTQIRLMGGDLVEYGASTLPNPDHRTWFTYMGEHMSDVLDAYSVHIYWNYWDIPRMEFRLRDVRHIVAEELPPAGRKPVYVTEFGVRGILNLPGQPQAPQPGFWEDGTPLARTNIAAFQQLWFTVLAGQLGYAGTVKWDAYWAAYDNTYKAAHYLIGPADEGWPLFPSYHALRLLFQTTARGWQILGVDPWADDDWTPDVDDQPEQELAAYQGPNGALTLVGLDTSGRGLNAVSPDASAYSVGGLPHDTPFTLVTWNAGGDGLNAVAGTVTSNAAGVVRFDVPLHAAFALTTVDLS